MADLPAHYSSNKKTNTFVLSVLKRCCPNTVVTQSLGSNEASYQRNNMVFGAFDSSPAFMALMRSTLQMIRSDPFHWGEAPDFYYDPTEHVTDLSDVATHPYSHEYPVNRGAEVAANLTLEDVQRHLVTDSMARIIEDARATRRLIHFKFPIKYQLVDSPPPADTPLPFSIDVTGVPQLKLAPLKVYRIPAADRLILGRAHTFSHRPPSFRTRS